jgi:hypothetical protein
MNTIRNLALVAAAAGAFTMGTTVLAQDAKKEEPKAKTEAPHAGGEHRGHGMQGMAGMNDMSGMRERCHAEQAKGEHQHKDEHK